MKRIKAILTVIAVAFALTAGALPALAQTLRGSVVLPDSVTPIQGAIVVAADARGTTVARALTSAGGEFTLRLPSEGRYALTVLRIGFRPTVLPPTAIAAGATETIRVVFSGAAVTLSAVNVRERETCRVSADTGLAVTRVWEEARKAMLSSQLNAGDAPLVAEWIEYDRTLDSAARYVRQQRIRTTRNSTTHAFVSARVEALDSAGYVVADSTGTTYYLPDADVLLSPTFAAAHCFRLKAPPGGAGDLIGVAFSPARDRRDIREIEGTIWVDRKTAELRTLELGYTNLPAVLEAGHPGGSVEFLRLNDGNWLINRWNVRMPQLGVTTRATTMGAKAMVTGSAAIVRATQVTGGEVNRVSRRDTVFYEWTGPHLRLQVQADDSIMRPRGALVALDGTDYTARADDAGRVDLSPVLAGRYRARIHTALMDSLGLPPIERDVEAREGTHVDTLMLPRARDLLAAVCPRDSVSHGEGMLRGRVFDHQGGALPQAAVIVTWQTSSVIGDLIARSEKSIGAFSDDVGSWRVCGVPRNIPLVVSVAVDSGSAARGTTLSNDFGVIDLALGTSTATEAEKTIASTGAITKQMAVLEVAVFNLTGAPVPNVTVDVQPPSGPTRRVVTGPTGRALIPEIAPGLLTVRARRIGFKEGQVAVTVERGRNTVPIILGESVAPTLDTMRVIGGRRAVGRHDEFETRRLNHMTTVSYTREDIHERNPVDIWQMLWGVPSIQIMQSNIVTAATTRSNRVTPDGRIVPCYLAVMVDGIMQSATGGDQNGPVDLTQLPKPEEIHGVEVFAGAAMIPPQYGGVGSGKWCGLIAVWTR